MPSPWFKRKLFKSVRNPECVLSRDSLEERLFETRCMQESKNAAPFCLPVLQTRSPREWWREASEVNYTKISLMRKAEPGASPVERKFHLPCVKRAISSLHAQGAPASETPVSQGLREWSPSWGNGGRGDIASLSACLWNHFRDRKEGDRGPSGRVEKPSGPPRESSEQFLFLRIRISFPTM